MQWHLDEIASQVGKLIEGDMDEMYPTTLSEFEIQSAAKEPILKQGDDAFALAQKEINTCTSLGGLGNLLSGITQPRKWV